MKITTLHQIFLECSGVCTDTRNITKDCLFFALRGDNFNGNEFAKEALAKGAKYAVVDEIEHQQEGKNTLHFDDVLSALQQLATYHRNFLGLPILAITGSNGKTTSKELIHAVLSKKFKTVATKGNLNNHIGVPLTLLSMDTTTELGIVEMGANHQKEIEHLSDIAKPDYGYITNFGKAHIEGFGSLEGVVQGKSELYTHIKNNGKLVFVNIENQRQLELTQNIPRFTFGTKESDCVIDLLDSKNNVVVAYNHLEIRSNLVGLYNFSNIAAAIAIGHFFDIEPSLMKVAIEGYEPQNNRSQIIKKHGHRIILDAYNANPTSMIAALLNFQQAAGTAKVMILGDMFELGHTAANEHQAIVDFLAENNFGRAFLVGENFYRTKCSGSHISSFPTFEAFKKHLQEQPLADSQLLIKGSRGMALERTLELL